MQGDCFWILRVKALNLNDRRGAARRNRLHRRGHLLLRRSPRGLWPLRLCLCRPLQGTARVAAGIAQLGSTVVVDGSPKSASESTAVSRWDVIHLSLGRDLSKIQNDAPCKSLRNCHVLTRPLDVEGSI